MIDTRTWFSRHPLAACRFLAAYLASPDEGRAEWAEMALDDALATGADRPDLIGERAERDRLRAEAAEALSRRYAELAATDPDAATRYSAIAADFAPGSRRALGTARTTSGPCPFYAKHNLGPALFVALYLGLGARATAMMFAILNWTDAMTNGTDVPELKGTDAEASAIEIAGLDGLTPAGASRH